MSRLPTVREKISMIPAICYVILCDAITNINLYSPCISDTCVRRNISCKNESNKQPKYMSKKIMFISVIILVGARYKNYHSMQISNFKNLGDILTTCARKAYCNIICITSSKICSIRHDARKFSVAFHSSECAWSWNSTKVKPQRLGATSKREQKVHRRSQYSAVSNKSYLALFWFRSMCGWRLDRFWWCLKYSCGVVIVCFRFMRGRVLSTLVLRCFSSDNLRILALASVIAVFLWTSIHLTALCREASLGERFVEL